MKRLTLSLAAIAALACTGVANAGEECPTGIDLEKTIQLVSEQKSCADAAKVARSCADWGSNADAAINNAAMEICTRDFTNISKRDLVTYEAVLKMCDKKYANLSGSLSNSGRSHCKLNVVELFSKLYTPVQSPK